MTRVIVVGAKGRMGSLVSAAVAAEEGMELVGGYDVDTIDQLDEVAPAADVVIDFSAPASLTYVASYVRRTKAALVSGTTGVSEDDLACLRSLGDVAPVIWSGNYSLGVATLRHLVAEASASLPGWDVEIEECHHNKKADAPSGTAKMLLRAVDPDGERPVCYGREGIVGPRPEGEIGMHSLRGGTVAGTHTVSFFGQDEELTLTHRATSRQIFVNGAIAAAKRLVTREPGFYDFDTLMFD
ncbi:MAG: 4-hydroxy-tetrahydrodipicolinate reductase [Tractidigestivibacter sp.]|uniref:4-hydroxy-tetrahydrodipicolinate reductase n=1 Tax=Tractidigestivibacter sp. TaxID=2847320 RepID=UPI003D947BDB